MALWNADCRVRPAAVEPYGLCEEPFVTYIIALPCVDVLDRACIEECPVDCIYEGERMLYIHPDECIECGACEPACPQEAIHFDGFTPSELQVFVDVNREVFTSLGSPGGSANIPSPIADHSIVAAFPALSQSSDGSQDPTRP